jgi:RNA polymerase sigma factor (sigma-70 family)
MFRRVVRITSQDTVNIAVAMNEDARAELGELLRSHRGIVLKVAGIYCRDAWDREDLAQEIAAQLWRAFPSFDRARKFSTWMYRIALNVAISFVRRRRVRARHDVPLDTTRHDVIDPNGRDPDADERTRLLYRFIEELGELDRALLTLYLDEYSHGDIAEVLGISETNVATKISRLRQRFGRQAAKGIPDGAR